MGLGDGRNFIAVTTDNPTTMISFRNKFERKFPWVITLPCFLHQLNTTIGEICLYPAMKTTISRSTRIVTFFNGSHYWGGQLKEEAARQGITRGFTKNCESCWYALILHCCSVKGYRYPLVTICCCLDANEKENGFSCIKAEVIEIVQATTTFWKRLDQLIRVTKPLVDAIGNLESREANLADCMLEMIRCARFISEMKLEQGDDADFLDNAKTVLNKRFRHMNTPIHSLALFLHPLCQKLAISDEAGGCDLQFMISAALKLASKWKWSARDAKALVENIKDYNLCKAPFIGGTKDGKAYWESLSVASDQVPLKKLAITIFLIVPSSSDLERLFSDLGGIQTPKRNNLNINTFEDLGKMHCNLRRHHHSELRAQGKSIRRKHGHMHTKTSPGINTAIVEEGSVTESDNWQGPLEVDEEQVEEEDVEASFDSLEKEIEVEKDIELELELEEELATLDIVEGKLYDFSELEKVDKGVEPKGFNDEINVLNDSADSTWDLKSLLRELGM
ncbi:hypothetical protein D9758_014132 [Tetrapyrgos nigripes]|uniref:DUF659 domain-containing protein n=1 Tax=Tetrapyrgos nigripes TaxID=182062 RepID=A0A8H5FPM0_9AGAR|nr:hypothetical protein D9758_014132 [Tetrapyrgos nigripes]